MDLEPEQLAALLAGANGDFTENRHVHYGLTKTRRDSLSRDKKSKDALLNPNSETALTLFLLGKLDNWQQCKGLSTSPRERKTDKTAWTKSFFENHRTNKDDYKDNYEDNFFKVSPLYTFLEKTFRPSKKNWNCRNGTLLFEVKASGQAFNGGETPKPLSFINIKQNQWSTFDALVMIPQEKLLVFIEAKLDSDMSRKTTKYPCVNQLMRNWEAAYFLTKGKDKNGTKDNGTSKYTDWDFRYLLICPKDDYKYGATYYSWVMEDKEKALENHHDLLKTKDRHKDTPGSVDPSRLKDFSEFEVAVKEKVKVVHWDCLWKELQKNDFEFENMKKSIERAFKKGKAKEYIGALEERLKRAGCL